MAEQREKEGRIHKSGGVNKLPEKEMHLEALIPRVLVRMFSSRPRRLLLALLALLALVFFFLAFASPTSRHNFFSTDPSTFPDEIFGLLHLVTSPDEQGRVLVTADDLARDHDATQEGALQNGVQLGGPVVPESPVDMSWYALGSIARAGERTRGRSGPVRAVRGGWAQRLDVLHAEYPLVVFSKSYCPYSKRAKNLLETYDLFPPPKIIEVDLRVDSSHIKTLLTRLTHRSTFPNVMLDGRSLGGSDDLAQLHEQDRLKGVLEAAGMQVRWTGEGGGV